MAIIGDYKNPNNSWAGGITIDKVRHRTNCYSIWTDLKKRSRACDGVAKHCPTYLGCSVSQEFGDFQVFANWCHSQVGYGITGYEIDKDILVAGNKEYHPDKCCFVPQALNAFVSKANGYGIRLAHPKNPASNFRVQMYVDGKPKSLGTYKTLEIARSVRKQAKQAEVLKWHKRLKAGEFIVDPRVIERLRVWQLN